MKQGLKQLSLISSQVAKWISDEERKPVPADTYVYEITEDAESDLVDLCQGQPPANDEEHNDQVRTPPTLDADSLMQCT